MLSSVGLRCRKELTKQFEGKQCPDIAVYNFDNGKKLLLDIAIAHPWAQNYIGQSCTTAGFAVAERDRIKNSIKMTYCVDTERPSSLACTDIFQLPGDNLVER